MLWWIPFGNGREINLARLKMIKKSQNERNVLPVLSGRHFEVLEISIALDRPPASGKDEDNSRSARVRSRNCRTRSIDVR